MRRGVHAGTLDDGELRGLEFRSAEFRRELDQRRIAALADVRDDCGDGLAHIVRRLRMPPQGIEGFCKTGLCVAENFHARAACSRDGATQASGGRQGAETFLSPICVRCGVAHPAGEATGANGRGLVVALRALPSTATGMSPLLCAPCALGDSRCASGRWLSIRNFIRCDRARFFL